MAENVVPLHSVKHSALKVIASIDCDRVKTEYLIPVVIQEFIVVASEHPIVFVKNELTGEFHTVAMTGLEPGENLFCTSGKWDSLVSPRLIKYSPFSLMYKDDNKKELVVCIDESSHLINREGGKLLFNENGEHSDYLKGITEVLLQNMESSQSTLKFIQHLVEKALLMPNRLTIEAGGEKREIDGLYVVDESKLNALPSGEFAELRQQGVLRLIYSHMNSLQQIPRLIMKKQEMSAQSK